MNQWIARLIFGMGCAGAVFILSVAFWFNPPVSNIVKLVSFGSLTLFITFTIAVMILRRRLEDSVKR